MPLGIIPRGTANAFSVALGIPTHTDDPINFATQAADVIIQVCCVVYMCAQRGSMREPPEWRFARLTGFDALGRENTGTHARQVETQGCPTEAIAQPKQQKQWGLLSKAVLVLRPSLCLLLYEFVLLAAYVCVYVYPLPSVARGTPLTSTQQRSPPRRSLTTT